METYISGEVPVPEGDEDKSLHKKNLVKAKRIIVDSIKDHLIPQVFSLNTPKEMFDSLTKLFEVNNINQKKYRNSVIFDEIDLDQYFSKEELEGDEAKDRAKRIIIDSIKDNLIPHVSSLNTLKGSIRCYDEAIKE